MKKLVSTLHSHPAKPNGKVLAKPTEGDTKAVIMAYLDSKGISYDSKQTKPELFLLVK